MDLREFLRAVITAREGWFCLALGPQRGQGWYEKWYRWPDDLERILQDALDDDTVLENNVYFSTYLFKTQASTKLIMPGGDSNIVPTRTIQADLDNADVTKLTNSLQPTILVETSPGRHQGFWLLGDTPLSPDAHEILSRKLTYSIQQCDTSGWPLGRKVRIPYTFNHKYLEGPQQVKIVKADPTHTVKEETLELLPDPPSFFSTKQDIEFLDALADDGATITIARGPNELLNAIKDKLPPSVYIQYNSRQQDRSRALWALLCSAFRAGLTREEVWWLGWHSANNKFRDLRTHAERELAADVLRAEATVHSNVVDPRLEMANARKAVGLVHERRQRMLKLAIDHLNGEGEFLHTSDDKCWYIRADLGRPIQVSAHSQWLNMVLDSQFGLNPIEQDHGYVANGLNNYVRGLEVNGIQQALSWYDAEHNALLLHAGGKYVYRITDDDIKKVIDGAYRVVFPWNVSTEEFDPMDIKSPSLDWGEVMFESALNNIVNLDKDAARALLKVWFMFLIFRSASASRPLLAFFGQPGSGKSTLARRIYRLLYGQQRALGGVTSQDNFDHAVASSPLVVLDNVDVPERWLPDRLAQSASISDIERRKLWTDGDSFILKRQALVGITAHNPHFTREDVSDRLLLFVFERIKHWLPEGDILDGIYKLRNQLWGAIMHDCQVVLRTPMPRYADVPQFRIEDFARAGYWIATALGCADDFARGIGSVSQSQRTSNLEEDQILVAALQAYTRKHQASEFRNVGFLWDDLLTLTPDQHAFQRVYRNAVFLGKKLWALQDSLREIMPAIEWVYDRDKGSRMWKFATDKGGSNGVTQEGNDIRRGNTVLFVGGRRINV